MNVWNHELPKGSEIRCSRNSEHFLPHIWHMSRFTQTNGNQSYQIKFIILYGVYVIKLYYISSFFRDSIIVGIVILINVAGCLIKREMQMVCDLHLHFRICNWREFQKRKAYSQFAGRIKKTLPTNCQLMFNICFGIESIEGWIPLNHFRAPSGRGGGGQKLTMFCNGRCKMWLKWLALLIKCCLTASITPAQLCINAYSYLHRFTEYKTMVL